MVSLLGLGERKSTKATNCHVLQRKYTMKFYRQYLKDIFEVIGAITVGIGILILIFGGEFHFKINFHSFIDLMNHFKNK